MIYNSLIFFYRVVIGDINTECIYYKFGKAFYHKPFVVFKKYYCEYEVE